MENGNDVIEEVRKRTDTILLAFSAGKDSVGTWLACQDRFNRIVPFYMYTVPGLTFIERTLAYYEDFFKTPIVRVPHPRLYRMLNNLVFQPPERIRIIRSWGFRNLNYFDIHELLREDLGIPSAYVADGVRAADSPQRRIALSRRGAINHGQKKFSPICDWRIADLWAAIEKSGIKLSKEYLLFGKSFDGIDYRFLEPLRREYPDDYQRILDWFPLAELEIVRREYAQAV